MSWNELELNIDVLQPYIVNQVYENIEYIKGALETKGISVDTLQVVNAKYDTQIVDVANKLQSIENDLDKINDNKAQSIYYTEHKDIGNIFTVDDYNRWVLILNDLYDIIANNKGIYKAIKIQENGQYKYMIIDNKQVVVRDEVV